MRRFLKAGAMRGEGASYRDNEMDAPDFTVSKYQTGSLQYVLKN
ncbi:hypothetical protein [Escherichia marmotae]|nr:hypothetical protein [Escherichia marmotae]